MKKTLLLLFAIMAFGLSGCDRNPLPAQAKMSDAVDVAPLKGCDMAIFDEGKVTFYNSRTNSLIPFADEQDRVIQGVFLNENEFYYTVVIDDELYLKKVDLLASHPAPVMLTDWDLKLSDCFDDNCGYAPMLRYSNVPMIGIQHNLEKMYCEFMDDRYYLPDDNTKSEGWPHDVNMGDGADEQEIQLLNDQDLFEQVDVEVEGADEDKSYYYYVPDVSSEVRICISDKIDFDSFKGEYSYEPQFELLGLNPQRDCVVYGAAVDFGHVGYGPLCFATLDGKVQKALCYDYNGACFGWLANGKLAYFGNDGIYVVSPDGTEQKIASPHEFVTCY